MAYNEHGLELAEAATATITITDIGNLGTKASATFVGTAALNDADGTNLILTNADGSTVTFHTDPTKNFGDTSSDGGDHTWIINTRDISGGSEVRKATQAFHIACLTAIAAGELDMTADPATNDGTQTEFTLTQTAAGAAGNTAITLITGMTADDETNFTDGESTIISIVTTDNITVTATASTTSTTISHTNTAKFIFASSTANTAVNLARCLDANIKLSAVSDGPVVTITQLPGSSGNTTITVTDAGDAGLTKEDFIGGVGTRTRFHERVTTEITGEPYDDRDGDFTMNHFKNITSSYKHKSIPQVPFSRAMIPVRDPRIVAAPLTSDNDVI